jgi:hypothetical protein
MSYETRYHNMIRPDRDGSRFTVIPRELADEDHVVTRHFGSYREAFVYAMGVVDALENAHPKLREAK